MQIIHVFFLCLGHNKFLRKFHQFDDVVILYLDHDSHYAIALKLKIIGTYLYRDIDEI